MLVDGLTGFHCTYTVLCKIRVVTYVEVDRKIEKKRQGIGSPHNLQCIIFKLDTFGRSWIQIMVFTWCKAIFSDCYSLYDLMLTSRGQLQEQFPVNSISAITHSRSQNWLKMINISFSHVLCHILSANQWGTLLAYWFSDSTSSKCNLCIVVKTLKWS